MLKLAPVPDAGDPPVAVQENVTGAVPPVDVAVQLTAVPTVPDVGHVIVTTSVGTEITTWADFVFVAELPSVAVTEIVNVPPEL